MLQNETDPLVNRDVEAYVQTRALRASPHSPQIMNGSDVISWTPGSAVAMRELDGSGDDQRQPNASVRYNARQAIPGLAEWASEKHEDSVTE